MIIINIIIDLIYGWRISNVNFFINSKNNEFSLYHKVHEFVNLEEVIESGVQIYSNFKRVSFRNSYYPSFKKQFSILKSDNFKKVFQAKDIIIPKDLMIINLNHDLFSCISSKINFKAILELEMRK